MYSYACTILCLITFVYGSEPEQKCYSRFDYDEKMLLKQLRFEDKVSKFEDQIKIMKDILESEQTLRNESFEHEMNDYRARNAEETERQQNVTTMMAEAVKQAEYTLNDTVKNFTEILSNKVKEMSVALDLEKNKFKKAFNDGKNELLERANAQNESHRLLIQKVYKAVEKAERDLKTSLDNQETLVKAVIERVDKAVEKYNKYIGEDVVFTVTDPYAEYGSTTLRFQTEITNEMNGYNTTTGIFVCPVAGLYYFSIHLVKKRGISLDEIGCYINVNDKNIVRAFFEPYDYSEYGDDEDERGGYGISTSMYVKLEVDDEVSVGDCRGTRSYYDTTMEPWSSFNGHLIRPYLQLE